MINAGAGCSDRPRCGGPWYFWSACTVAIPTPRNLTRHLAASGRRAAYRSPWQRCRVANDAIKPLRTCCPPGSGRRATGVADGHLSRRM